MQNSVPAIPEVGKTYISKKDPTFKIHVTQVVEVEADEDSDGGFHVEGCDPKHIGKAWAGYTEMTDEEWIEYEMVHDSTP